MRILEDMWLLLNHGFWYGTAQPWISSIAYLSSWMCHQQLWRTPNYVPPLHCELCLAQWTAQDDHDHTIIPLHIFLWNFFWFLCLIWCVWFCRFSFLVCTCARYMCICVRNCYICNFVMSWQVIEDLMTFREQVLRVIMDLGSTVITLLVNYILNLWTFVLLLQVY
jgi:hypothetical protein